MRLVSRDTWLRLRASHGNCNLDRLGEAAPRGVACTRHHQLRPTPVREAHLGSHLGLYDKDSRPCTLMAWHLTAPLCAA